MGPDTSPKPAAWYLAATDRISAPLAKLARWLHLLLFIGFLTPVSAHEVIVERVVNLVVNPQGDRVVLWLHLPASVLGVDRTRTDESLRVVAADIARTLDVQQGDTTLPPPTTTVRVADDGNSIDLELRYASRIGGQPFSARLNTFDAAAGPVRTNVAYRPGSGREQRLSVTGPPIRVTLDPLFSDVVQQFISRGVRALTDGGDHLLFLLCILIPVRRARSAFALFLAGALGQVMSIAISLRPAPPTAESLAVIAMIAASVVVVAALQNVVRAQLRWVVLLAFAFGALNGFTFGGTLSAAAQFAGEHSRMAVPVFVLAVLVGELWLGALAWATRTWLDGRGVPERAFSLVAAAIIAHTAVHRMLDRGAIVAQTGSFNAEHAVVWLSLGWACVMLAIAIANAVSGRALETKGADAS